MLAKFLTGLCVLVVTSANEGDLLTVAMKGYYDYELDDLSQFYIPSGQCSGLVNGDLLLIHDCISGKNAAVRVSVADSPQYASVYIEDTLDKVTIRRRENTDCEGKAMVTVEVQCQGPLSSPSRRSGQSSNAFRRSKSWTYPVALQPVPLL